jgi:hypothetical protein
VKTLKTEKVAKIAVLVLLTSVMLIGGGTRPAPAVAEPTGGGRDNCWMTGGGSIFDVEYGGRVTHGFVLHCVPRNSDNLQVVDHVSGQSFHLERLISATCPDDPAIDPNPPDAVFDTFNGMGEGRCKQPDRPCIATWTFTDGGERGGCVRDTAFIEVREANGEPVFSVSGDVDCGNHQAHSR